MAESKVVEVKQPAGADVERTRNQPVFAPEVDIVEGQDAVTVFADMPGADETSVQVTLENGILQLEGWTPEVQRDRYRPGRREYGTGSYARSFAISEDVDAKGIQATVNNGVLRIVLPKAEAVKPRRIAVKAE